MIRYLYASQLAQHPTLADGMFRDRTAQFIGRLKWDLKANAEGWELDDYDRMNPLYIIVEQPDGSHGASMRVMPTIGRTMANDHFSHLNDGVRIRAPFIWECTRFCVTPTPQGNPRALAGTLMLAGQELGMRFGLTRALGIYEAHMERIYRNIGWQPTFIGADGVGREKICLGLWPFAPEIRDTIAQRAGLSPTIAADWFDAAFPATAPAIAA